MPSVGQIGGTFPGPEWSVANCIKCTAPPRFSSLPSFFSRSHSTSFVRVAAITEGIKGSTNSRFASLLFFFSSRLPSSGRLKSQGTDSNALAFRRFNRVVHGPRCFRGNFKGSGIVGHRRETTTYWGIWDALLKIMRESRRSVMNESTVRVCWEECLERQRFCFSEIRVSLFRWIPMEKNGRIDRFHLHLMINFNEKNVSVIEIEMELLKNWNWNCNCYITIWIIEMHWKMILKYLRW